MLKTSRTDVWGVSVSSSGHQGAECYATKSCGTSQVSWYDENVAILVSSMLGELLVRSANSMSYFKGLLAMNHRKVSQLETSSKYQYGIVIFAGAELVCGGHVFCKYGNNVLQFKQ